VAVVALHFIPLNGYIAGAREVMSQRLGVPVDISELRYALLPSPKLTLSAEAYGDDRNKPWIGCGAWSPGLRCP
jgi:hypothetical protein